MLSEPRHPDDARRSLNLWRHIAAGAFLMSLNALITGVLVLARAVRKGAPVGIALMAAIIAWLLVAGGIGGAVFAFLRRRRTSYYVTWAIAAEAALAAALVEFNLARLWLWPGDTHDGSQSAAVFLFTDPRGIALFAGVTACAGLYYGRVWRNRSSINREDW